MARLTATVDGGVVRDEALSKDRTTLGRRPGHDIVIDHRTVSGEHAVLHRRPDGVMLEDLGSTNGTFVNGQAITRHLLKDNDLLEFGQYAMRYRSETPARQPRQAPEGPPLAAIRILSGPANGRQMPLVKRVTTLGRADGAVASITCLAQGYELAALSGEPAPRLNGEPVGDRPVPLRHGDLIELAGTRLQFTHA